MKRTLMMTAAICALSTTICALSLPALAHSGGPSGPSQTMTGQQSQAQGQGQSQNQSQIARGGNASARATGGSATGGQGGAGGQGGQGGRSTATNTVNVDAGDGEGGYGTRSNTPDAIAPAIVGGGVCTVGASGASRAGSSWLASRRAISRRTTMRWRGVSVSSRLGHLGSQ